MPVYSPARIRSLLLNDIGAILKKPALERIFANVRAMPASFATRHDAENYLRRAYATFGLTDGEWPAFIAISLQPLEGGTWRLACDPRISEPLARDTKNLHRNRRCEPRGNLEKSGRARHMILHGERSDILDAETVQAMRAMHLQTECITVPGVGPRARPHERGANRPRRALAGARQRGHPPLGALNRRGENTG